MLNPIRIVKDLFEDKELSDTNLRGFCDDHLVRLAKPLNNPGGIYNTLITNTTSKYNAFYGKIGTETSYKADAESTTAVKNQARKAATEKISQLQGLIKYKFGEDSGTYQLFYPLGMDEYYQAREAAIENLFNRFVEKAVAHLTADYPAEVTSITNLVAAFSAAYTARESAVADVDTSGTGKHEDRKILTLQLTTNFYTIALNNLENPDKFGDYFDPSYLPLSDGPETFNGIINAGITLSAVPENKITGSSNVLLENTGLIPLIFSLNNVPTSLNPNPEQQITIQPGQRLRFTEGLPVLDKYYLIIQNTSPSENGKWHVEVS